MVVSSNVIAGIGECVGRRGIFGPGARLWTASRRQVAAPGRVGGPDRIAGGVGDGSHLWADRFDRTVEDLFALQDEIARKVLIELQVKLTFGEHPRVSSRGTRSLDAWLLRNQAYAEGSKLTREGMLKAWETDRGRSLPSRRRCASVPVIPPGSTGCWAPPCT